MTEQSDDSSLEVDDISDILGIIDLSQIHLLPSADLWSNKDYKNDVLSDVSSQSDKKSSISGSLDSVSVVSSSESEDSFVSVDNSQDSTNPNVLYGVNFNKAQSLLFEGQNLGIRYHVNTLSHLMKYLDTIFKHLLLQSKYNVESILYSSFEVFKKVHKTVCILSSLGYLTFTSEMVKSIRMKNLIAIFKKIYSDFAAFHTHMCKLLSTDVHSTISSKLIELIPFSIDTLFCILRFLLYYIKQKNTQSDMINIFVNILNYCALLCCSYLDHSEEVLNKISILSIYRLVILFMPLDSVYSIAEDANTTGLDYKPDYKLIIEPLFEEYLSDDFKPSTLVLEKLRSYSYENKSNKFEAEINLTKMTRESLETCIVTGVTRRQYPTFQIDPIGFFDLVTNNPLSELWKRINFWLLQRLDSHHSEIRRTALNIIRHALCTVNFNEKDRQHILSYVYNCLTDDDTLPNSLSILMYVSRLYPLKDGAVRRISNLTLKGLRKDVKLKVLEFFSKCNYTQKGLEFLLTVLKSLCNYSYDSFDSEHKGVKEKSRNSGEINFIMSEWPKIVDILCSVSNSHKNIAKLVVPTDDVTPYITQKRLCTIPVSIWVSLLWSYLTNTDDDRWRLFKCLWFSEAKIRFPSIVKSLSEQDKKLFDSYCKLNDEFVNFGTDGKPDISVDFIKDLNNWKILHEIRIPYPFDHLDKTSSLFVDEFALDTSKDVFTHFGDGCKCVDCRMDLVINDIDHKIFNNSSGAKKFPYNPFSSIFNNAKCEVMDDHKPEPPEPFELQSDISQLNNNVHETYSFAMSRFKTKPFNADIRNMALNVDDVCCYEFPAPLGTSLSFGFSCKSRTFPSDLLIFYKFPRVINPEVNFNDSKASCSNLLHSRVDYMKPSLRLDENEADLYHGTVTFNLKFPYATSVPFPVDFYYKLGDNIKKFGLIWIHPKITC
ncbi:hypothetical protein TpMuguga_02g00262 [Theileria parva strain Muguga]|uniref:Uncharacterized protein n=1 Tax=Theileria parva TaxID=5875 RepID=Q4N5M8_THEPA|nr:uncharacterized protein TpMuguga_02g00262 [Theileria parva strain Muguga]EAN32545.1 hypothetical protein TpMuguga_02g00262 [Theileria parva strain Muguga]|eukprot:XP_764828.1 hypothetical protein [Theileria parva strain Muguga]